MIRPITLATALSIGASALAGQNTALNSQFQARYDAFVTGYLRKDIKAVGRILADDFNGGSKLGPIKKQHVLDALKKSKNAFNTKSRKVLSVVINGNLASVVEDSVTTGSMPDPKTKKPHKFEIQMRSLDTWEKNATGWQLKQLRTIKSKTLEDGHPFKGDPNH